MGDYYRSEEAVALNPDGEICWGCRKVATGYAFVGADRYCHGDNDGPGMTCYEKAVAGFPPEYVARKYR